MSGDDGQDRYQRRAELLRAHRTRIVKRELANLESGIRTLNRKSVPPRPDLLAVMETRHQALSQELARLQEEAS